ncbi:hypothetical protein ABZV91_30510 [Nocardia sp. NPDC004568]|uniref:hypothetical protein n=1 Tax=Nocardia sp. NPDC004568 TaxID=3154551 RepID=UPI0033B1DF74
MTGENPEQVVQIGEVITVKILDINREHRRITPVAQAGSRSWLRGAPIRLTMSTTRFVANSAICGRGWARRSGEFLPKIRKDPRW